MGVVLPESLELVCVLTKNLFEHVRCYDTLLHVPHHVERFGIGHHKTTLGAQRIFDLHVSDELKFLVEEVLREFVAIGETLQTGVHVASISKIG